MKRLRLALVTRRFWPMVGGAEQVMANLATQMNQGGHDVRLLTARWEKHWPSQVEHRGVPVTRLKHSTARGWGMLRYMRALARWLKSHSSELDAVLVSMLKHDAYAAIGAMKNTDIPVVVRAEGGGETGDCHWHETGRFGMRIRRKCQQADAVIACSRQIFTELNTAGFSGAKIHDVPSGVTVWPEWSLQRQGNARAALADAHEILQVDPLAPLVVFTGRLHPKKGLMDLVNCWPRVLVEYPAARLWLVGEGPDGPRLWDRIRELGLTDRIILPGSFDDICGVLHAADAYVLPSYEEGMSMALLEAMSAGLPLVATDIPGNRQLIEPGRQGRVFPPGDIEALSAAILTTLNDRAAARTMASNAREQVTNQFSIEKMTQQHLEVIRTAIAARQRAN